MKALWAFKVPQKERFTVYPRKILKRALQKAKCAVDDKKIHVVDYETMSNKKTVDCLLTLADTRGTKHLEKVIEICKQVNAELTVFHQAQVIYKWSLYEPNRNILSYRRKVNRTQSRIEQGCKVIMASEFSPTTDFILKTAIKVKADLIVVAAKVGPLIALMGGSTTRQIIGESTRPVVVLI